MGYERIGFVGAGLMGHGMAKNLLAGGHPVTLIAHRNREPIESLLKIGAKEADDLNSLAEASDIVFICAPGSPQVEAIVAALKDGLAKGSVVIDCSTSQPTSSQKLAKELAEIGVAFADAPLGGTPVQAEAGELSSMVGASEDLFARIEPVIRCWAKTVDRIGDVGAGHTMKLLMNFISLGYGALYAEALSLAKKADIDVSTFYEVLSPSRMGCGFFETFFGYAHGGDVNAHKFTLTNALKDTTYLANLAEAVELVNPMCSAVRNSYAMAVATGGDGAENYVPHLVDYVARQNKIDL